MDAHQRASPRVWNNPGGKILNPPDEPALAVWENEGGRANAAPRNESQTGDTPWPPLLPPGYTAQPVLGFRDKTGRLSYEFNRVYGPPTLDRRGPICLQDEERSYWCVTWSVVGARGDSRLTGRAMNYAEARSLLGSHLTFGRFFAMRAQLPEMLGAETRTGETV